MDHTLKIDDRTHEVSVSTAEGEGVRRFTVDGEAHEVAPCTAPNGALGAVIDGRKTVLYAARCPEGTWVWHAGRARLVRDAEEEERRAPRRAGTGGAGAVTPAFPSVVVAVLVKEGDVVRKGQPLVIVSSMKMEVPLVAPHAGTVRAIRAEAGGSVRPGDELVEIEPAAEGAGDE